jgi:amidase
LSIIITMASVPGHGKFGKARLAGWIPSVSDDHPPVFDPLTTSAAALQKMLAAGTLTSVQVLNEYYRQILKYNGYLRGVYRLAPGERARELDEMRAEGKVLGPLHGIPVLIKVGALVFRLHVGELRDSG